MTRNWAWRWLLLGWLCLVLGTAPLPTMLVQRQGPAQATLIGDRVAGERLEVRLSGQILLTLSVAGSAKLEVDVPPRLTDPEQWKVLAQGPPRLVPLEDGRVRWEQTYHLDPWRPGEQLLQLTSLRFRTNPGTWQQVDWEPIPILVTTQVQRPDLGAIRDITPIEDLPQAPAWPWWVPITVLGVAVALLVGVWLARRRPLPQVLPLSPARAALHELDRADTLSLATAADVNRYHTLLSRAVRRYLEQRFALPASRQTTAEFFETLGRASHLTPEQQTLLHDLLERCDLAKFAPVTPSPEECRATAAMTRTFIRSSTNNTNKHE